jgi:head-tail adaptor
LSEKVEQANKKNEDTTRDLKKEQQQRKQLYNEVEDLKGKIRVFARIRPLNSKERQQGK